MYYEGLHPYEGLRLLVESMNTATDLTHIATIKKLIDMELAALKTVQEKELKKYLKPEIKVIKPSKGTENDKGI